MNITFLFRHPGRYSIEQVFDTIATELNRKGYDVNKIYMPYFKITPIKLLKNILFVRKLKENFIHITGDVHYAALVLSPKRTVLTIHDINLIHNKSGLSRWFLSSLWYKLPIKRIKYITCISQFTKDEILKIYPWAQKKLRVIHNPVDPRYKRFEKNFNTDEPVILHIGTTENKNLLRIIEALDGVKCHLRIIGKINSQQTASLLKHHINYSNAVSISNEQMVEEYRNCDVVCFPSLYEGFGMPVIEGQSTGRIVVTSTIDVLMEVSGKGAIFVDPYNIESIKKGFQKAIGDAKFREYIINHGFENVKQYSADFISQQYLNLYKEINTNF